MNQIKTTAIYGLGALGMLFGSKLQKAYGPENVKFVMDSPRYARHQKDRYTINDEPFDFALQDAADVTGPSDLVIVAVKGPALVITAGNLRHLLLESFIPMQPPATGKVFTK